MSIEDLERKFDREKLRLRPGLTGFIGDHPGRIKRCTLTIQVKMTQTVPGLEGYSPTRELRNAKMKKIYREFLESVMNEASFGYVITVEVK